MRKEVKTALKNVSNNRRHKEGVAHERIKGLVSICVPNYNKNQHLQETIESIVNQSYKNIEIILVDDGSTDGSRETIENAIQKYGSLRKFVYLPLPVRCGTAWAQNMAYYLSKGEFIANWDSDDLCHEDRIKLQVNYLNFEQKDLCGTNFIIFGSDPKYPTTTDGGSWLKYDPEKIKDSYIVDGVHCICFGSVMFRYPILEKIIGMSKEFIGTEDYDFIDRAICNGFEPGNLNEALYYYRSTDSQRSVLFHGSSV